MTFTKTRPKKPGDFRYRESDSGDGKLGELFWDCGKLIFSCQDFSEDIRFLKGKWCGPLVPAEEVEKAYKEGFQDRNAYTNTEFETESWGHSRARRVAEGEEV